MKENIFLIIKRMLKFTLALIYQHYFLSVVFLFWKHVKFTQYFY